MATQSPPDPPPSITASELRRRLLSSTPPPANGTATIEIDPPKSGPITTETLLRKLKMPSHVQTDNVGKRTPISLSGVLTGNYGDAPIGESPSAELHRLRGENKELRQLLGEMKILLQEASDNEQTLARTSAETEQKLAESMARVEELQSHLQQIEDQIASGELAPAQPQGPPKTKTELEEWADELEKENSMLTQLRRQLETDRKQFHEDEESLEKQMRDMEVSMARERALMARQETELKRLSAEIQHELELMQRGDASLREQMQKFQRRAQEVLSPQRGNSGTVSYAKR